MNGKEIFMSDKMMKIAGKTPNNTAAGVSVNSDGQIINNHKWESIVKWLVDAKPTDGTAIKVGFDNETRILVSNYAVASLRIMNNTGVPVRIRFQSDVVYGNQNYLQGIDGKDIEVTVLSSNSRLVVITPTDLPILNYLHALKFTCAFSETPTNIPETGTTLQIAAVVKR